MLVKGRAGWLIRGRIKRDDHHFAFLTDYSFCTRQDGLNHAVVKKQLPNLSSLERGPVVRTLRFHCRGPRVRSLVGEVRSRMPRGAAKKNPKTPPQVSFLFMFGVHHRLPQRASPHLWLQDAGGPSSLSAFCRVRGQREREPGALCIGW